MNSWLVLSQDDHYSCLKLDICMSKDTVASLGESTDFAVLSNSDSSRSWPPSSALGHSHCFILSYIICLYSTYWKVFGFPYFRNWIRESTILFPLREAELHESTQREERNKGCQLKISPLLHVKLPGVSAQEKAHVLSLEQSQQKDEMNKGKEHRGIPDKAWRKARAQGCVHGRSV